MKNVLSKYLSPLNWLWSMSRGMQGIMLINCVVGTLHIMASLAFVWFCKRIVDFATGVQQGNLTGYIVLMLGLMVCMIFFSGWESWLRGQNGIRSNNLLRQTVFERVMKSSWEGQDRFHTGDAMNRLEEDIRVVSQAISTDIPNFFLTIVQLFAASAFLFMLDARLLWVILILMPIAILVSKMFYRKMKNLTQQVRKQESSIQGIMQENLQHRLLVQTLGCMEQAVGKLSDFQDQLYITFHTRLNYTTRSRIFLQTGFSGGYCIAFLWGIFGIQAGTVTFGMMTAFLQLVAQVQRPIVNLTQYIPTFISLITSIERLQELTNLPQEEIREQQPMQGPVGIRISDVCYHYPDAKKQVLNHLSHDFLPGSTTAVVGETGAGKSTLIRLLLSLMQPQNGEILLYNAQTKQPVSPSARVNFMYVPQGNSLMSGTIRENLLLGNPQATEDEMKEVLHRVCADFVFLRPDGLDSTCGEIGSGLSEGQAQRIAIARALLHQGSILILDEASSALDSQTEREILETLRKINDKTVIWVTHHDAVTQYMQHVLTIG